MSEPFKLKDEAANYIEMVYPGGLERGTEQHQDVEAAFIAGAFRAAGIILEANGTKAVVEEVMAQSGQYVEDGLAAELAKNKRN